MKHHRPHAGRRAHGSAMLVAALALSTAPAAAWLAGPRDEAAEREARIVRLLWDARVPEPDMEALSERLEPDVERGFGFLFDVLEDRRVPELDEEPAQRLSVNQRDVILGAMARLDPRDVLRHAWDAVADPPAIFERAALMQVIGAVGEAEQVRMLFDLARPEDEEELPPSLEKDFQQALTGVLRRDPKAFHDVLAARRGQPDSVVVPVLYAVGEVRSPLGMDFLASCLEWHPELARATLAQVRLLEPAWSADAGSALAAQIRPYLLDTDVEACRAACLALAALRDPECVPILIGLLDHERVGIRENALFALRELSGMGYPGTVKLWEEWHTAEQTWYENERRALVGQLRSPDVAKVAAALRALAAHEFRRDELARDVATVLDHQDQSLRVLACDLLKGLGSRQVTGDLVRTLGNRRESVRNAAHGALVALTGLQLPPDRAAWEARLGIDG